MEDTKIVDLFWQRSPDALVWAGRKYGRLCHKVAGNILPCSEDAEECINDAFLALWNSIPPTRPKSLGGYIATLVRNTCLTRYRKDHTEKRGGSETALALDELAFCIPDGSDVAREYEAKALRREIDRFLATLSKDDRMIFLYRYWLMLPMQEIADRFGFSQSKIGSSLHRSRKKLKAHLAKEEWI